MAEDTTTPSSAQQAVIAINKVAQVIETFNNSIIPASRMPGLTGDVTSTAGTVATTITANAVTNAKLAPMAQATVKGRASGAGTGDPTDLTATQTSALLDYASAGDVQAGTSTTKPISPSTLIGSAAEQTLTDGATINWNVATGYNAKVTLTDSGHNFAAPTNAVAGVSYTLRIIQDGNGSRTATWDAAFGWGAAGTPTLTTTANKYDLVAMYCVVGGGSPAFACTIVKGFG